MSLPYLKNVIAGLDPAIPIIRDYRVEPDNDTRSKKVIAGLDPAIPIIRDYRVEPDNDTRSSPIMTRGRA